MTAIRALRRVGTAGSTGNIASGKEFGILGFRNMPTGGAGEGKGGCLFGLLSEIKLVKPSLALCLIDRKQIRI